MVRSIGIPPARKLGTLSTRTVGLPPTHPAATLLVLLATACGAAPSDSRTALVRDSAGITIVENGATAPRATWHLDPPPAFEFGGGESGPGSDLLLVSAAHRLPDGTVAIADLKSRILMVGADGEILHIARRHDADLGEFRRVNWIERTSDGLLAIFESTLHRISYLSTSGELIGSARPQPLRKSEPVPPWFVGIFADGTLLSMQLLFSDTTGSPEPMRPNYLLQLHSSDGSVLKVLGIAPGSGLVITSQTFQTGPVAPAASPAPPARRPDPQFSRRTSIAVGTESYIVAPGDEYELREYTQDGNLRRLIRMAHQPVPIPSEALVPATGSAQEVSPKGATYPAHGSVMLDDAGNIWVEAFRMNDDTPAHWLVFDPAGQLLATITMPDRFRPLQFGADFVLGVARDDLGVEQARVHRLIKG
jgi:hypothetical protein